MEKLAFPAYEGTYLQILPVELRNLLYQYAKHCDMKYKIKKPEAKPDSIRLQLELNNVRMSMMMDTNMLSASKIRAFVQELIMTTREGIEILKEDEGILKINESNVLSVIFVRYGEEVWLLTSDPNDPSGAALSYIVIPICIELMEALGEVSNFLKD